MQCRCIASISSVGKLEMVQAACKFDVGAVDGAGYGGPMLSCVMHHSISKKPLRHAAQKRVSDLGGAAFWLMLAARQDCLTWPATPALAMCSETPRNCCKTGRLKLAVRRQRAQKEARISMLRSTMRRRATQRESLIAWHVQAWLGCTAHETVVLACVLTRHHRSRNAPAPSKLTFPPG